MSGTFITYNGYKHLPGEVKYQLRVESILNAAEYPVGAKYRVDLLGRLIAVTQNTQAELTQKINALRQAYVSGGDLLFILNDGSVSPLSIYNSKTLGGLRVIKPPEFPDGGAAQYATVLDYTIGLEAEIPQVVNGLWSFDESFEFVGDGLSATDVLVPQKGLSVPQTTKQFTPIRAVQRGEAVGYLGYPTPQAPRFPRPVLQGQLTRVSMKSPRAIGKGKDRDYKLFPISWEYHYVSPVGFAALPAIWPANQ